MFKSTTFKKSQTKARRQIVSKIDQKLNQIEGFVSRKQTETQKRLLTQNKNKNMQKTLRLAKMPVDLMEAKTKKRLIKRQIVVKRKCSVIKPSQKVKFSFRNRIGEMSIGEQLENNVFVSFIQSSISKHLLKNLNLMNEFKDVSNADPTKERKAQIEQQRPERGYNPFYSGVELFKKKDNL